MIPAHLQIIPFYQKSIIESGFIIDEDLVYVSAERLIKEKDKIKLPKKYIMFGTMWIGVFCLLHKEKVTLYATAAALGIPVLSSYLVSFYNAKKAIKLSQTLNDLLVGFKTVSRAQTEVRDFLVCFEKNLDKLNASFVRVSEDSAIELGTTAYDLQLSINKLITKIILKLHVGLKNVSLNLDDFDRIASIYLNHTTIANCLFNSDFVEGQLILLRSHLLTSIYLMCCVNGDPKLLSRVMTKDVPPLIAVMETGVSQIKLKLRAIRFPDQSATLNLIRFEKIMSQRAVGCSPKITRHVTKINDSICCTVLRLRAVLGILDNIHSDQLIQLEEVMGHLTRDLFECYTSTSTFAKILEVTNRKDNRNAERKNLDLVRPAEEPVVISNSDEKSVEVLPAEDLYKVFHTYTSGDVEMEDGNNLERPTASELLKGLPVEELGGLCVRELRESRLFKTRQSMFEVGQASKPKESGTTCPPHLQPLEKHDLLDTAQSLNFSTPEAMQLQRLPSTINFFDDKPSSAMGPPHPPPMMDFDSESTSSSSSTYSPRSFQPFASSSSVSIPPPPPPPLPMVPPDETDLQRSLKMALHKRGVTHEDSYE